MQAEKKFNGEYRDQDYEASSQSTPSIETIVENERIETDMARVTAPPASTFVQKIGPNTILTLIGLIVGAAVGWGIASQTISQLQSDLKGTKTDVKVLQRAQADADSERAAMRQWMIDHGIKLATPPAPPIVNGEEK